MYVRMCVYMYACMRVCVYMYVCMYVYMYVCVCTCIRAVFRILWKGGEICVSGNEGGAKPPLVCV